MEPDGTCAILIRMKPIGGSTGLEIDPAYKIHAHSLQIDTFEDLEEQKSLL